MAPAARKARSQLVVAAAIGSIGTWTFCAPGAPAGAAGSLRGSTVAIARTPVESHQRSSSASGAALTSLGMMGLVAARASAVTRRARGGEDGGDERSVEALTSANRAAIDDLRSACKDVLTDQDDLWLLRFVLEKNGDVAEAAANVREVIEWRKGEGAAIVASADKAIAEATAGGGWNNEPIYAAAPHTDKLKNFLTPECIVVLSLKSGDLMSCIRAAAIDSPKMMDAVTVDELTEFFIYSREINSRVAQMRSKQTGRLTKLVAANDLTGVSSFPDSRFQEALTGSSKKAVTLYPGLAGPTVLLNLPWLARALVGLLAPLFPGAVRDKLKFARTPMDYMKSLTDILKEPIKGQFLADIAAVLES